MFSPQDQVDLRQATGGQVTSPLIPADTCDRADGVLRSLPREDGTYYCLNMILITLSSFLNAFVVYMSFYGARRPVPRIMKKKKKETCLQAPAHRSDKSCVLV
ncbi:hypothetical protein C0Q70_00863 [Pomacea canaliculata]|uniref:Uncharacterized protein n=1 Tax=Pomacea canaliculata TaxID=400727 RepID=A0A2T7PXU9_POMCA|nr:hypothetical protein C0Q70_00863 [Pomacea canaliculata]